MKTLSDSTFKEAPNPIWLSVSEAASLGGVQGKTIRRALKDLDSGLVFKIVKNRYQIDFASLIIFLHRNTKLENKLKNIGLGQYIKEWKAFE
jgi:hypothetical protein